MLILLPVALLVITAITVLAINRFRPSFGYSWLLACIVSFIVWIIILTFRWRTGTHISFNTYSALGDPVLFPDLLLDQTSWTYAFCMVTLVLAVLLTASARLQRNTNPVAWAGSLILTGLGLLAILAAGPLTLIMTWTAIDLAELAIVLGTVAQGINARQATVAFASRISGTLLVIWALITSSEGAHTFSFDAIPKEAGLFLLLAAGLRLGVFPLHLPYRQEIPMRRGVGNIVRLVGPASALALLGRLTDLEISPFLYLVLYGFCALAALYGAFRWFLSEEELNGRPYWIISLASFAILCVLRNLADASISWGIFLLMGGGMIFLFSARSKRIFFLPILFILSLSTLPYTPFMKGWQGVWILPFHIMNLPFLLAYVFLLTGYFKHSLVRGDDIHSMDRWIQVVYPAGLIFAISAGWLVAYLNPTNLVLPDTWWTGIAGFILALIGMVLLKTSSVAGKITDLTSELSNRKFIDKLGTLEVVFSLQWVYRGAASLFLILQTVVRFITEILEGDGGVLWAFILLGLLVSLLRIGVAP